MARKRDCRIVLDVDGERVGPFCSIREAKRAIECAGKVRLVPVETIACKRRWDVDCRGETIGSACEVPESVPRRSVPYYDPEFPGNDGS